MNVTFLTNKTEFAVSVREMMDFLEDLPDDQEIVLTAQWGELEEEDSERRAALEEEYRVVAGPVELEIKADPCSWPEGRHKAWEGLGE